MRLQGGIEALIALARRELLAVFALLFVAGSVLTFAELAGDVLEGDTRAFDETVLLALRNPADKTDPLGPPWLEIALQDVTSLGGNTVVTMMTIFALGFLLVVGKKGAALLVLVCIGGGAALSTFLKMGFARPRPDLVAHLVEVQSASFPSGHAMLSAVTYLTLGALLARVQARRRVRAYLLGVAVLLTVTIGISRIYLGVHWPTDVLAGWCLGAAWAMLCWMAALFLQRRGQVETTSAAEEKG